MKGFFDQESCIPAWSVAGRTCPHGSLIKLFASDFTWPNSVGPMEYIAMFYSSVPFLSLIVIVLLLIYHRGQRELAAFVYFPVVTGFVSFTLKHLLQQIRPDGSCITSCGMPSGHAIMAIGVATVLLCELFSRDAITGIGKALPATFVLLILFPVPWSRVWLNDHSVPQVLVGSLVGMAVGVMYHVFLRKVVVPHGGRLEHATGITDNYTPKKLRYDGLAMSQSNNGELEEARAATSQSNKLLIR